MRGNGGWNSLNGMEMNEMEWNGMMGIVCLREKIPKIFSEYKPYSVFD